ncbi:MAG: S8 family peptidase [Prevotella sp.]|nr:S8 family peptidase [Prevotella sp.]
MKRLSSTILVAFFTLSLLAQGWNTNSKMSPWLLNKYEQQQAAVRENGGPLRSQGLSVVNYILALVESTDGDATIKQKGGVVWQDFGNGFCAAFLPMDSLGVLDQCASILRMEANEPCRPLNEHSSKILGVDKVWAGEDQLPQAFRGEGVLAGVMDVGFDFTHPAFRHDDGTSRFVWFWDPFEENDNPEEVGKIYNSPDEVLAAEHSSDAEKKDHGSHVMGSMAGRGLDGRYVGMAPEADLIGGHVPLGVTLDDAFMKHFEKFLASHIKEDLLNQLLTLKYSDVFDIVMLNEIFKKADELGKPCVVNWSFGIHPDFSSDHSAYETVLNTMLGPGRIVVASAGNEGGNMTYVKKEAGQPMEQDIYCNYLYDFQIRSKMDDPFFKIGLTFEYLEDTIFIDMHDVVAQTAFNKVYTIEGYGVPKSENYDYIYEEEYDPLLFPFTVEVKTTGYVGDKAGFMFHLTPPPIYPRTETIKGKILIDTPVELDLMGSPEDTGTGVFFSDDNRRNSRGCHLGTISFPGGLERIITVGAMHQCSSFTNIFGNPTTTFNYGSEEGHLASFSSCGPTLDGRVKPDVVAPGHNILSVFNSFYSSLLRDIEDMTVYRTNVFDKEYAMWAMSGTSMSSPITAGVIALWLQANPNLTPEDIKGVIQRTSHQPEPEFSGPDKNNYYGWGEIDAYAGLLDILGLTGIEEISKHQPAGMKFRLEGHTLHIDGLDGVASVTVFDLNGRPVLRTETTDGIILLPELAAGVYAVQVGKQGSTLIRL